MPVPVMLVGAKIVLYINNKQYKEVESLSFSVDYGEEEIRGIDTHYPQEIGSNNISISGQVNGFRLKNSGGLQGHNMRPLFTDVTASNYISIRIEDRQTQENILYIPNAKITNESHSVDAKGVYRLNFSFKGLVPLFALDRA